MNGIRDEVDLTDHKPLDSYWFPFFSGDAQPGIAMLDGHLLLAVFSYLQARDLGRVACVCKGLQLLPWDESLWYPLCQQQWEVDVGPAAIDNWRAEYKIRGEKKARERAYMNAMMYGRVGRGANAPKRLSGPGLSFFKASSAALSSGLDSVPMNRLAALSTAPPARPLPEDVAQRPPPEVAARTAATFTGRQGSMKWSALG